MSAEPNARPAVSPAELRRLFEEHSEGDRRQRDRARAYLMLSSLTATVSAADFIETLADVCEANARHAVSRGHTRRERERWCRLGELLEEEIDRQSGACRP